MQLVGAPLVSCRQLFRIDCHTVTAISVTTMFEKLPLLRVKRIADAFIAWFFSNFSAVAFRDAALSGHPEYVVVVVVPDARTYSRRDRFSYECTAQ